MKKITETILIVEDDPDLQELLDLLLKQNKYESITAFNGKEALLKLKNMEKLPDLIISDICMPVMDGFKFFQNLSQSSEYSQIPFIFLSSSSPIDIKESANLSVYDYIQKPFDYDFLLARIKKIIKTNSLPA